MIVIAHIGENRQWMLSLTTGHDLWLEPVNVTCVNS